jgi:hypothetical protein
MFGQLLYAGTDGYTEYLLADAHDVRAVVCYVYRAVVLYRIEWKDTVGYTCNTAVYSLADAMAVFQEKVSPDLAALPRWLDDLAASQESVGR